MLHAEGRLQRGEAIKLVEHTSAPGVALQVDDDPHAVPVALVPHVGNALDPLLADQFGDAFHQARLVHLIGDFRDDDGLRGPSPGSRWPSCRAPRRSRDRSVRRIAGPVRPMISPPVGKSGPGTMSMQGFQCDLGIVQQGSRSQRVDDLPQIVRRDIGGHADRDPLAPFTSRFGNLRRAKPAARVIGRHSSVRNRRSPYRYRPAVVGRCGRAAPSVYRMAAADRRRRSRSCPARRSSG